MPTDSSSSPKPEMLEKAREIKAKCDHAPYITPSACDSCIALALEEAVRVEAEEHATCERVKNAALRASEAAVESLTRNQDVMLDDLGALLRALDLGDHARPISPHEVMRECISEVEKIGRDTVRVLAEVESLTKERDEARAQVAAYRSEQQARVRTIEAALAEATKADRARWINAYREGVGATFDALGEVRDERMMIVMRRANGSACPRCNGAGEVSCDSVNDCGDPLDGEVECPDCAGTGEIPLAAIRAPRPAEPMHCELVCEVCHGEGDQCRCDCHDRPASPTPPTSPPVRHADGCASWFLDRMGEPLSCDMGCEPTPPSEEPR